MCDITQASIRSATLLVRECDQSGLAPPGSTPNLMCVRRAKSSHSSLPHPPSTSRDDILTENSHKGTDDPPRSITKAVYLVSKHSSALSSYWTSKPRCHLDSITVCPCVEFTSQGHCVEVTGQGHCSYPTAVDRDLAAAWRGVGGIVHPRSVLPWTVAPSGEC